MICILLYVLNVQFQLDSNMFTGGPVYTVWGRTSCPVTAERVYSGLYGLSCYNFPIKDHIKVHTRCYYYWLLCSILENIIFK